MNAAKMKVAVSEGRGDIRVVEVAVPRPTDYQGLCKIEAAATCSGTDMKILSNKLPWKLEYPGIVGHESIGTVIETGHKVRAFREGDRYFRPTAAYAGSRHDGYTPITGGFAEYGVITDVRAMQEDGLEPPGYARYQMPVPADVEIEPGDATMLITLKEVAGFIMNLNVTLNQGVVVLGSGPVAMVMCFFAKLRGAYPLVVVGRRDEPLDYIKRFGVNATVNNTREDVAGRVREITGGRGADYVIDTAGEDQLLLDSFKLLAEHGKIAPYATLNRPAVLKEVDETRVLKAGTGEVAAHDYMFDLVRLKLLELRAFYSHRMPFGEVARGFKMLQCKEASKIVFEM